MATGAWEEIYRGFTQAELEAELVTLKKSLAGGFVSQGSSNVNHSRDVNELRDRLQAATRIKNEKFPSGDPGSEPATPAPYRGRRGTVDFSGVSRRGL
jgi:hypothetical protein